MKGQFVMGSDFQKFADAVSANFKRLSALELYEVTGTDLYTAYLLAFPEGTDPIYRVRTQHDCSCCKSFIRNIGGVVAIIDGERHSIWNVSNLPYPYDVVAAALDNLVMSMPISYVFRRKEYSFSHSSTHQDSDNGILTWHHFYGALANRHRIDDVAKVRGESATAAAVLERGIKELKISAVDTVLDLINSNAIYRGAEFKGLVEAFATIQLKYYNSNNRDLVIWSNIDSPAVSRFRNAVIGTLTQDISDGVDVERAVKSYEDKVAPFNYKRPTAVITKNMIDQALKTLNGLGLEQCIERRFATISDISINDILWVDNGSRNKLKDDGLRSILLASTSEKPVKESNATRITYTDFISNILPTAQNIEVLVKNTHQGNFMSITAPVHENTGRLFKWNNDFAWSYEGEVTDSVRQRVKSAGGNINAALRVSLAWSNYDDLDLHAACPDGHVYYGSKMGILDVDMNAGGGQTREPVENLAWIKPKNGKYHIYVNQFSKRENDNVGFTIEIECNGSIQQFNSRNSPTHNRNIDCFSFTMKNGELTDFNVIDKSLTGGELSVTKWGVKTQAFVPVVTIMNSPNHWEGAGAIGNEHLFFILENCVNDGSVRGIYNEFLRGELDQHRKVFEVLGSKTKCEPSAKQLSGLGFSTTKKDEVTVRVKSATSTRSYTLTF